MAYDRTTAFGRAMRYLRPTGAVVVGMIAASVGFALAPEWTQLELAEIILASGYGVLIIGGLYLAVYGLFIGVERSVAAGRERTVTDPPSA